MKGKMSLVMAVLLCVFLSPLVFADPAGDALVRAAQNSDEALLRQALRRGANINYLLNERTALMEACFNQWLLGVRILVDEGRADINFKNMIGETALFITVEKCNNLTIVQYLVDRGANVNDKDRQNKTVLMYAVENQNPSMVDFLIRAGANIGTTDTFGQDALILAAKNGYKFAVDRLLQELATKKDSDGRTAFFYACMNDDIDMMAMFVKRGIADALAQDNTGIPPLLWLIQHKHDYKVIEYLVKNTNALDSRDKNGRDAKWYADRYEGNTQLRRLLESGR